MDLANKIKFRSWRGILTLPFRGYALFFRHRGISHSFLFGTLTRVLWLLLLFIVVSCVYQQAIPNHRNLINLYGLTQEQCALKLGKERSTVTNILRVLALPQIVQDDLIQDKLFHQKLMVYQ